MPGKSAYESSKYNAGWDNGWDKNPRFKDHVTVEAVIKMNKDGMTQPEIADYFGVSREVILNRFRKAGVRAINWHYVKGKYKQSIETKEKIGKANSIYRKGKTWEEIYGVEKAQELKSLWSVSQRIKLLDKENHPCRTQEAKDKISFKAKERYKDANYLKRILTFTGKNKQERLVEELLNSLGYDYQFVGDGKVIIDGKCPDFISGNNIIEFFGKHWHKNEDEQNRIDYFSKRGYNTMVIWDFELKDLKLLENRIRSFHNASCD